MSEAIDPGFPVPAPQPEADDTVAILMTERQAKSLGLKLAGPVFFGDDDVPTYIISIR